MAPAHSEAQFPETSWLFGFNLLHHSVVGSLLIPVPHISINREETFSLPKKHKEHGVSTPLSPSLSLLPPWRMAECSTWWGPRAQYLLSALSEVFTLPNYVFVFRNQHWYISKRSGVLIKQWNIKISHSSSYLSVVLLLHFYLIFQREALSPVFPF